MDNRRALLIVAVALAATAIVYAAFKASLTPLDRAENLYFRRRFAQAEAALMDVLRSPLTPEERCKAEYLLGRVHLEQGKYDVVHESLSRLGGLWEHTTTTRRNYAEALPHLLRADSLAARLSPPDTLLARRVAFWTAKSAYFLGDWDTARRVFSRLDSSAVGYLDPGPYVPDSSVALALQTSSVSGRIVHQAEPVGGVHVLLVRTQKGGYASVVSSLVSQLEDWITIRKLKHPGEPPQVLVAGDLWYHTVTDRAGRFAIPNLEPGSYEWEIIYDASLLGTYRGHYAVARDFPRVRAPKDSSAQIVLADMVICDRVRMLAPADGALLREGPVVLGWGWRTYPGPEGFKVKTRVSGMISTGASVGAVDSVLAVYAASGDSIAGSFEAVLPPGNYLWEVLVSTQRDSAIASELASFSVREGSRPEVSALENRAAREALRDAQKALLQKPLTRTGRLERCVSRYPHTTWAPNAMYDVAYAYLRARQVEEATTWLRKVLDTYPGTQQARWARIALDKIAAQDFNIQLL